MSFPQALMFLVFPSVGSVVPKSSSELKWWVNHSSEEQKSHFETSINESKNHLTMKELCLESQHFWMFERILPVAAWFQVASFPKPTLFGSCMFRAFFTLNSLFCPNVSFLPCLFPFSLCSPFYLVFWLCFLLLWVLWHYLSAMVNVWH